MESKKPELSRLLLCSKKGLTVKEICRCAVSDRKGKMKRIFRRRTVYRNLKSLVSVGFAEKIHEKRSRRRGVRDKIRYRAREGYLKADGFFEGPPVAHVDIPLRKIKGNEYFGKMVTRYARPHFRIFTSEKKRHLEAKEKTT